MENRKIGVPEVPEGDPRAPYIGSAGRFLGAICISGGQASSSVARGAVRCQRFAPLIYRGPVASPIAHSMEVSLLVRPVIL